MLSWGKPTIAHHVRPLLFRECPVYDLTYRCQLYDLGCRLLLREDKEQVDSTDLTPKFQRQKSPQQPDRMSSQVHIDH